MYIEISGGSRRKNDYAASIMEFVADKLMPRMADKVGVNLEFVSGLKNNEGIFGDCIWEDDDFRPREFTIRVDNGLDLRTALTTIAHEMVHVKQYARDEMRQLTTKSCSRYNGAYYADDLDYWDQPWEIEAHGRETGLFIRWAEKEGLSNKSWAQEK
jgi:hypothetical protein